MMVSSVHIQETRNNMYISELQVQVGRFYFYHQQLFTIVVVVLAGCEDQKEVKEKVMVEKWCDWGFRQTT